MAQARATTGAAEGRRLEFLKVAELHFDFENPRLPSSVDGTDDAAVLRWMLADASLLDLMDSIAAHGYFDGEPILAVRRRQSGYVVVEGNRRLAAIKLLQDPDAAPTRKRSVKELVSSAAHKPTEIPALIFHARTDILQYLGYRHITGVKEWEPLAKARYVRQLFDNTKGSDAERFRELARNIGSGKRADYVARLLTAFALYERTEEEDFFNIPALSEDSLKFSFFQVALNHLPVVEFFGIGSAQDISLEGLKKKHLKEFVTWSFRRREDGTTVLGDSRNMWMLARVVSNERALKALRNGDSLAVANNLTGAPNEVFAFEVRQARDRLLTAQTEQHLVTKVEAATADHLNEIERSAGLLRKFARDLSNEE